MEKGNDKSAPTPVRQVMEGAEDGTEEVQTSRSVSDPDTGQEWTVSVTGRSAGGVLPLRTVPLLELAFSRPSEPDRPLRAALHPGQQLAQLTDADLLSALERSEPYRSSMRAEEPRKNPRRKGSKG